MSNLWKLKDWLHLDAAADVLTKNLGENIRELDILRWAIAGKITLALLFWMPFWAQKYVAKETTESDMREPFETMNARRFFSAPSEKSLGGMLKFWASRKNVLSDISQIFWSLPEASRRHALEVLSQNSRPKAAEVIEFLNSRLHERPEFLDKPLTKEPPFHSISIHEHLSPVGDEVTFYKSGFYSFAEHGGSYGLLKMAAMGCLGNFEEASKLFPGFFDGIFLVDANGVYIQLLDRLPVEKWQSDNPRHRDNFYPTDFNYDPTICVLPNDLATFIASNSQPPEFNRWQSPRLELQKVAPRLKIDLQIDEIVQAAISLNYDLMSVPAGGKGRIEMICLANHGAINGNNAFLRAWEKATAAKKIKSVVPGV